MLLPPSKRLQLQPLYNALPVPGGHWHCGTSLGEGYTLADGIKKKHARFMILYAHIGWEGVCSGVFRVNY